MDGFFLMRREAIISTKKTAKFRLLSRFMEQKKSEKV